ncbi:hypothetical protein BD410DRAFT_793190 [Rickenella mellea]|uniref:BTB domain-containing protein n=1 Tax=Rickenella mellea TaxID=50990 RepID=A0A4Y7PTK7_9AGAM|nr:hypothetical protein BD410DRAFT_793190 [Rickenella mellea]
MAEQNTPLKRHACETTDVEPSSKRTRLMESEEKSQHPNLWFDDGSVVLSSEQTLFRVHRSVLSFNSTIFRDMFSLPPGEDAGEDPEDTWEGLPLVKMHDDDEDIANFLTALYDRTYSLSSLPIDVLAGLLRTSTKYEVAHLRTQAIKYLGPIYDLSYRSLTTLQPYTTKTHGVQFATLIINTARETKAELLLPGAFFFLAMQDIDVIFETVTKEERPRYKISMDDLKTCINGREQLIKFNRDNIYSFGDSPDQKCSTAPWCISKMSEFVNSPVCKEHTVDPNATAVLDPDFWTPLTPLCSKCLETHRRSSRKGLRKVINLLPLYFKFSDWATLRKSTGQALST